MSSGPDSTPFRTFTSTRRYFDGAPVALGRNHSSWFIIYARPYGKHMKRTDMSLNFIIPGDASTVSAPTSTADQKLRFTIGGLQGEMAFDNLLALRDSQGRCPVSVVTRFTEASGGDAQTYELEGVVEVDVPENELAYACARCGLWETMGAPRFLRCGGCKGRCYCSQECQKADWTRACHKGDCALLKEGKTYEVETRRRLHNNILTSCISSHEPEDKYDHAMGRGDYIYLAYGERTPPRGVPANTRPPAVSPTSNNGLLPGFVPTGDLAADKQLASQHPLLRRPSPSVFDP